VRRLRAVRKSPSRSSRANTEPVSWESGECFRSVFEHSAIGMALVSTEGRWLKVNEALTRMLGYSEAELLKMTFQAISHPQDLPDNLASLRRALRGDISTYQTHKRYLHKDGRTIAAHLTVSLVRDPAGKPRYFVSQIQRLGKRVTARSGNATLRMELAHSERVALMGHLAASLAHELLQPITAILGNAEATQRLIAGGQTSSPDLPAYVNDIIQSGSRAGQIIAGVRNLFRRQPQIRQRLDLNRLIETSVDVMRSNLISRRVRLVKELDEPLPAIMGDAVELQQVVLNLLLNAAEALNDTPPDDREITIRTLTRKGSVEIAVSDRGPGLAPAQLQRIFEPFYSTKRHGMGMGLTISAEIARAHGGHLWAQNNSGLGATFYLSVPFD
jgi:PAS domain S-box-containing protein